MMIKNICLDILKITKKMRSLFLQIISNKATKKGVGIAKSMEVYYIVAKYDSIY